MSRITFVLPGYFPYPIGGYRVVYTYASYLARQGHAVTIYHAQIPAGSQFTGTGRVARYRGALASARLADPRPIWFELDDRVVVRNVAFLTPRAVRPCDVLVATAVHTAPLVAAVARRRGIHGVYFLQSFEDWSAPQDFVEATWRLPLTRVVIAPWLQVKGRELGVKASLVPNAIDPEDIPAGPRIAERTTTLIALVSEMPGKRTDLVTSVMRSLATAVDGFRGATFGTCPRPPELPEAVLHYDNPERTVLRRLYQDSRVYLCASDSEGWHLPAAEAMAAGAAVVSTDIDGVRAYADATAVFAPVGDGPALADAALSLLRDPDRCQRLASAGQANILRHGPGDAAAAFAEVLLSGSTA